MQNNQNDNIEEESTFIIISEAIIRLPGMKHFCVTLENINGSRVFVVWELIESDTNRRIIFPVNVYQEFLVIIEYFLSIGYDINDIIENTYVDMDYTRTINTEDDRIYDFNFYI
ncbi:hypothetical protein RF11_06925 [Thelohanellus kitauei]|uniref:Uncharacterized protein n=1 Tax=Thelohanellus kitauei TaxID=669202 RepID=A0A0C2N3M9_THEKT|nr:hypothetical protein RF11_06925 [Thelohanellus kitauei]